jgi:trehalose 6-phosphate synthase
MPEEEQRARMRTMRGLVRGFNVYRWAGNMLMDAAGMRRRGRLLEGTIAPERWFRLLAGRDALQRGT